MTDARLPGFRIGLNSFGEVPTVSGRAISDAETIRALVEEARLAESVGIDIFSVGEHYREGHTDSAAPVLLAAIAASTDRIGIGTSVTVLSTNDPVRLYQSFATVDAVSNGRTELVLGRASTTDSFPLFGYDLTEYEDLFEERLDLFMRLQREEFVTWSGRFRPPLVEQRLHPRMAAGGIPTWIGVGGSPASVVRAARYGLPLMLAIIGGEPRRFRGHVDLYQRALQEFGHPKQSVGQHSLGLVADSDGEARDLWWKYWQPVVERFGQERGFYAASRDRFESEVETGALFVGSPETVAEKIAITARDLQLDRFDLKYDIQHLPRTARARTIELLGTEVAPRVRALLSQEEVAPSATSTLEGAAS